MFANKTLQGYKIANSKSQHSPLTPTVQLLFFRNRSGVAAQPEKGSLIKSRSSNKPPPQSLILSLYCLIPHGRTLAKSHHTREFSWIASPMALPLLRFHCSPPVIARSVHLRRTRPVLLSRVVVRAKKGGNGETAPAVVWFKNDLRINDHPGLIEAVEKHETVVPLYVFDPCILSGYFFVF